MIKRTPEQLARKRELYKLNREKMSDEEKARQLSLNKIRYERRKEKASKKAREWQKRNPERHQANKLKWREQKADHIKQYEKRRWAENKTSFVEKQKERYKSDIIYNIVKRLRATLTQALNVSGARKFYKSSELLGISLREFKVYLESKFQEGMSWENRSEWHIDHIRPCASFDLQNSEEQRKCFHYTNLQPLWKIDNHKKGSLYNGVFHRHSKSFLD